MSVKRKQRNESYIVTLLWFARAILYRLSGDAGPLIYVIKNRKTPNRTICNVLNEIYHGTKSEYVRSRIMEAVIMAKKMDNQLKVYKHDCKVVNNNQKQ